MKQRKLFVSLAIIVLLAVTVPPAALAQSSSYNMTVSGLSYKIYYGTHIYGSTGADKYYIDSDDGAYFKSRAYCITCDTGASDWAYIYIDSVEDSADFNTDYSSSSYLLRCQIYNRYDYSDTVSGRYEVR